MDVTDKELFDAALSDAPVQETAPEPVAEQTPEQAAIARDEQGRFAAKAASEEAPEQTQDQPAEQAATEQAPRPGFVPSSRLKEEADARRAATERAQQLEQMLTQMLQKQAQPAPQANAQPEPAPEIWDDPDKFIDNRLGSVKSQVQEANAYWSRKFAEQTHGAEKINEAQAALLAACERGEMDRATVEAKLSSLPDPYGEMVAWFEKTAPQRDPEAYKQKIIADYLASQGGQAAQPAQAAQQGTASVVRIPTSLNRTTSGASNTLPSDGDMSDASLFANAMRK